MYAQGQVRSATLPVPHLLLVLLHAGLEGRKLLLQVLVDGRRVVVAGSSVLETKRQGAEGGLRKQVVTRFASRLWSLLARLPLAGLTVWARLRNSASFSSRNLAMSCSASALARFIVWIFSVGRDEERKVRASTTRSRRKGPRSNKKGGARAEVERADGRSDREQRGALATPAEARGERERERARRKWSEEMEEGWSPASLLVCSKPSSTQGQMWLCPQCLHEKVGRQSARRERRAGRRVGSKENETELHTLSRERERHRPHSRRRQYFLKRSSVRNVTTSKQERE